MIPRASQSHLDPATDAAALLRRLGFATLVFGVPAAALFARRATVVLVPIGVALLVIAALLDGSEITFRRSLMGILGGPTGLAGLLLVGWAALSIVWTPFPGPAGEKIFNIAGVLVVAILGVACLPDRVRSSNLYLVPVGAGLAALLALWLAFSGAGEVVDPEGGAFERGLITLAIAVWPAIGWLVSRARPYSAAALGFVVALTAAYAAQRPVVLALGAGGLVFALATLRPLIAIRVTAIVTAGGLALAPLFPFILRPFLKAFSGPLYPGATALRIWAEVMGSEPVQLITGHGLDTSLRARLAGYLPSGAPQALPFEIWYELGIVGAFAGAAALWFGVHALRRLHRPLVPGALAAMISAFTLACAGAANAQAWWLAGLEAVIITFVAVERGQFRDKRPKAAIFRRG